jgi:hypothetical protein
MGEPEVLQLLGQPKLTRKYKDDGFLHAWDGCSVMFVEAKVASSNGRIALFALRSRIQQDQTAGVER